MRWFIRVDSIIRRLTQAAALTCVGIGLLSIAAEWVFRQIVDENIIFGWLEVSMVLLALAGAFSLPSIVVQRKRRQRASIGLSFSACILAVVSATLATFFTICALWGGADLAYSYFFPNFTLREPFLLIAFCMGLWTFRSVASASGNLRLSEDCSENISSDMVVATVILTASVLVIGFSHGTTENTSSLMTQISWGLVSDSGFGTLVVISFFVAAVSRICCNMPDSHRALLRVFGNPRRSTEATALYPGLQVSTSVVGSVQPLGRLPLLLALLLGLSTSQAVAATALPSLIIVLGGLGGIAWWRPRGTLHTSGSFSEHRIIVVPVVSMTILTVLAVVMGYARPIEATAVLSVAIAGSMLIVTRQDLRPSELARDVAIHTGTICLWALAGGALYIASGIIARELVVDFVLGQRPQAEVITAGGLVLATLLARWLSPIAIGVCLLPVLPSSLEATGAASEQVLVIYCSVIAVGTLAQAYIAGGFARSSRLRLFVWLCCSTVALLLFSAFPHLSTILTEQRRFW